MSTLTSYIAFWMILFVLLGAFWYVIDRRYGVHWYRRWYRLTRPEPLPEGIVAGFVYNRRTRHKALMATVLSTLQTALALLQGENLNLLVELVLWLVEVPMTLLGFALGPWAYRLWQRKDVVFDKLDEWEGGSGMKEKEKGGREAIEAELEAMREARRAREAEAASPPPAEPKRDDPPPENPRDAIRRYTDR
jgi:hypothetical protein